jgi:thioredoxin-dependent peroxiredoxin
MRIISVLLASLVLVASAAALEVGDHAPDFTLTDQNGKAVRLSDSHGKSNVVVAFYVMAFTPG